MINKSGYGIWHTLTHSVICTEAVGPIAKWLLENYFQEIISVEGEKRVIEDLQKLKATDLLKQYFPNV